MDPFSKITKWLDHNRYLAIGLACAGISVAYLGGCSLFESKTTSLRDSSKQVDRGGLSVEVSKLAADLAAEEAEINAAIAKHNAKVEATNDSIESANADLDAKDAKKAQIIQAIGGAVTSVISGGPINPVGLATTGLGLLGLFAGGGAVADNRRKDKVIKKMGSEPKKA